MSHSLSWPWARVLAHRGGGTLAPENTIAGIRVGTEFGFRAIEFDAMLPADEVPILMHDETLGRTVAGAGRIAAMTHAEITARDAGGWHSSPFAGERVPSFALAIEYCRQHGVWPNIEIKPAAGFEERTGEIVARETARLYADVMRAGGDAAANIDPRAPLFSSFKKSALLAARAAAPDIPRGFLIDQVPAHWRDELESVGAVSLHTNHKHLTPELARAVKDAGYWLFCYT
ncbi:MAG: glycerophosphodiester phosphodiesterase family protein, partial [Burkholderiaceae bacterium]